MQRARGEASRNGWAVCREPLIATVMPALSEVGNV
jgi:hypothetical protein